MKSILFCFILLLVTPAIKAQTGNYIQYAMTITSDDEESKMMVDMMEGSTMTIVNDGNYSYINTSMGGFSTTEISIDIEKDTMILLMTGMLGNMAYASSIDSLENDEDTIITNYVYTKDTKKILGYTCKKAILSAEDGSESIFWYTEKLKPAQYVEAMPNGLPGLCLEMTMVSEEMTITYLASEIKLNIEAKDYFIVIPDDVEVLPMSDLDDY